MKTISVDAADGFVIETESGFQIFKEMHDLLETFPNRKIILTGANDEEYKKCGLDKMPYEVFTLKHNPEKTNPKYFEIMLKHFGLSKDNVVYFEHNQEAVKSADRLLGYSVSLFTSRKSNAYTGTSEEKVPPFRYY